MHLIRCATVCVDNLAVTCERYAHWFDYQMVEQGQLSPSLAEAWRAPKAAGAAVAVLRPASGRDVFLRFVEAPRHPDYEPLKSYGWNALELCVADVERVAARMAKSPFENIGPPQSIAGLPAILPMQVRGPDNEIVYLTEIRDDLPLFHLPRAESLVDSLFILVMGCSDLAQSRDWFRDHLNLAVGRHEMAITYSMLAKAYDLPASQLHTIATLVHGSDIFLELDQYPVGAVDRPCIDGWLPPGIAIGSFWHPDFDKVITQCESLCIGTPQRHASAVYGGRDVVTLIAPDGTLVEVIDGR